MLPSYLFTAILIGVAVAFHILFIHLQVFFLFSFNVFRPLWVSLPIHLCPLLFSISLSIDPFFPNSLPPVLVIFGGGAIENIVIILKWSFNIVLGKISLY